MAQLMGDHDVGGRHPVLDVTDAVRRHARDVVRPRLMDTGRCLQRLQPRGDGGHRVVLDVDRIDGVFEAMGLLHDHDGHGLTDISHLPERQRIVLERPQLPPER